MKDFNWNYGMKIKQKNLKRDVALRINKTGIRADGTQRYSVSFIIQRAACNKIEKGLHNLAFAVYEDARVYFKAMPAGGEGYTLCVGNGRKPFIRACISDDDMVTFWRDNVGDYKLYHDAEEGLYYIDLMKKQVR